MNTFKQWSKKTSALFFPLIYCKRGNTHSKNMSWCMIIALKFYTNNLHYSKLKEDNQNKSALIIKDEVRTCSHTQHTCLSMLCRARLWTSQPIRETILNHDGNTRPMARLDFEYFTFLCPENRPTKFYYFYTSPEDFPCSVYNL